MSKLTGIWVPDDIITLTIPADSKENLSWLDRCLLGMIRLLSQPVCYATNNYFAATFSCSTATITRSVKTLKKLKLINHNGWRNRNRILKVNETLIIELHKTDIAPVPGHSQLPELIPGTPQGVPGDHPAIPVAVVRIKPEAADLPLHKELVFIPTNILSSDMIQIQQLLNDTLKLYNFGLFSYKQLKNIAIFFTSKNLNSKFIPYLFEKVVYMKGLKSPLGYLYTCLSSESKNFQTEYHDFLEFIKLKNNTQTRTFKKQSFQLTNAERDEITQFMNVDLKNYYAAHK